jgi:hypothetical protein
MPPKAKAIATNVATNTVVVHVNSEKKTPKRRQRRKPAVQQSAPQATMPLREIIRNDQYFMHPLYEHHPEKRAQHTVFAPHGTVTTIPNAQLTNPEPLPSPYTITEIPQIVNTTQLPKQEASPISNRTKNAFIAEDMRQQAVKKQAERDARKSQFLAEKRLIDENQARNLSEAINTGHVTTRRGTGS